MVLGGAWFDRQQGWLLRGLIFFDIALENKIIAPIF